MTTPPTQTAEVSTKSDTLNEVSRTTPEQRFKLTFSEGLLLAIGSSSAYLLTFQYEKGFASYFGIPPQFVSVGLLNVLFGAVLLFGFVFFTVGIVNIIVAFIPLRFTEHPVFVRRAVGVGILSVGSFAVAYIQNTIVWWLVFLALTLLNIVTYFVLPIFTNKEESGYLNKLEAETKKEQSSASANLFSLLARKFGPNLSLLWWFSLLGIFLSEGAGQVAAEKQKAFLITTLQSNEVVLLRRYGDELIFAPFDRRTSEVQKSFIVLKVEALATPLRLEVIGPLKPVDSPRLSQPPAVPPPQTNPNP